MKKKVLVFMVAAALVSGCSKEETSAPADSELIKLKSVAYTVEASTRVPFEKPIGAENKLTALVLSAEATGDYDTPHAKGTITFNDPARAAAYNSPLESGVASFPAGDQVHAFGVYPAEGWTQTASTLSYTFDGKTDVLGTDEVLVKKSDVNADNAPTLEFEHLLTKLHVRFQGEANVVAGLGTIKSVELVKNGGVDVKNTVMFTPANASTTSFAAATAATTLPFYVATGIIGYTDKPYTDEAYILTSTPTLQAYALVAPVTVAAGEDAYTLRIKRTSSGTDVVDPEVSFDLTAKDGSEFVGNTAGKFFTVTIFYTQEGIIKASAKVEDWSKEGESHAGIKVPATAAP